MAHRVIDEYAGGQLTSGRQTGQRIIDSGYAVFFFAMEILPPSENPPVARGCAISLYPVFSIIISGLCSENSTGPQWSANDIPWIS